MIHIINIHCNRLTLLIQQYFNKTVTFDAFTMVKIFQYDKSKKIACNLLTRNEIYISYDSYDLNNDIYYIIAINSSDEELINEEDLLTF